MTIFAARLFFPGKCDCNMPRETPAGYIPGITIDCVVFGFIDYQLKILLVQRDIEPCRGQWQLPGGWISLTENTDEAAQRILEEATGVPNIYMEQLQAFGQVERFPEERIITIAYTALINPKDYHLIHGPDVSDVQWFDVREDLPLAFDHEHILNAALKNLKMRVRQAPIGFELLPEKFTLPQILSLFESILGEPLDRRNFRKKLLSMNVLEKLPETQRNGPHRAAHLYQFNQDEYEYLTERGYAKYLF